MKVLAIDTAGWSSSVALWEDGHELSFQENTQERSQAALLPLLVKDVLGEQKADLILVNLGPGSFTGIRIGLAFAKGFSMGCARPLKGINSFMATYSSLNTQENVLILREAHRQDVFGMLFQKGIPQPPQSLTRKDIEKILNSPSPPFLSGTGIHPFLDGLSFKEMSSPWRGAQALAYTFFKDQTIATDPAPFYVRDADVNLLNVIPECKAKLSPERV
ncbi:MAG: tRNA (adenosine(37)-N6)-threonylcarbamoyltransferase complex dimerization subunit type 1 TsaB [Proteobacteria bacterium]|nr:tRNA (adenosine(37)-N6)-threonylcarbamoyltransferase complex dimerization subunit type 1 TsaB [Pseudomonadota bacterium]